MTNDKVQHLRNEPSLRFKTFFDNYSDKSLESIANIVMGQSPDSKSYNNDSIGMPLIQGNADINMRYSNPRNYTSSPTKQCVEGDLIMTVRAPVGYVAKSLHNACIGRGVCTIQPNIDSKYLYQLLLKQEDKWSKYSQGSTFEAVNSKDIKGLKLKIPSLGEQYKVGRFTTLIDDKIELLEGKLGNLKLFKRGFIDKTFTIREGKNVYGDKIKKYKVSDFLKIADNNKFKFYKNKLITVKLHNKGVLQSNPGKLLTEGATNYFTRYQGQFIYGKQNFHNGAFGIVPEILDGYGSSSDIPSFDFVKKLHNSYLFVEYFKSNNTYLKYENYTTGTGSKRLSPTEFLKREILYFYDVTIEKKYSNLLNKLNKQLYLNSKKLENLKHFKKGLLQKMFI